MMTIGDAQILQGHSLAILRTLPADSVNCCVTSPPYWNLRDYGVDGQIGLEKTPEEYVEHIVAVFEEVRRVLRPDGTCFINLGDSYASDGKWGGKSGSKNETSAAGGYCREKKYTGLKPKDLIGIPWKVAFALQAAGWWLRQDIIWSKPNPMPESVRDRCTKAHEYIFLLTKSARYWYDAEAIKEPAQVRDDERPFGNAGGNRHGDEKRVYKMPDGWDAGRGVHGSYHRQGREKGKKQFKRTEGGGGTYFNGHSGNRKADGTLLCGPMRNKRDVWEIATQPFPEAHFATYPEKLVEPCILAGCPEGGTVLDPFHGAGTTGVVALNHCRKYIGIELNQEYIAISEPRIREAWKHQPRLFKESL